MDNLKLDSDDSPTPTKSRLRPPPDFTRRSIKLRIFVLLACLFAVLAVAERAADPRMWNWLTELDERSQNPAKVQTRLTPKAARTEHDPFGTFVASAGGDEEAEAPSAAVPPSTPSSDALFNPVERAWNQGWRDLLRTLSPDQRELVFRWLLAGQKGEAAPEEIREASGELVKLLDERWNSYHATAFQAVQNLSDDDRVLWVDVLRQINGRWTSDVRPALDAIIAGNPPDAKQQAAIGLLEQTLRRLSLDLVQDDTVFRPAEREVWFHLLAQLQEMPNSQLGPSAPEDVLFLQLFKQSGDYRGKLVRIRGVVKQGYRIDAPENYLGIKEYNVLTIHPAGGPDSPILVYTLELPKGFPAIKHRDKDGGPTKLHEDVVITGYYFKRLAFPAVGGTYTAPLLVARNADWTPRVSLAEATGRTRWTVAQVAGLIIVAAVATALVMVFIVWRIRRDTRESITHTFNDPVDDPQFAGLDVRPEAREALGELARQAERTGSPSDNTQERGT